MDTLTSLERSARMKLIKAKNTKPEMIVRKLIFSLGYRYRLHRIDLPGCPDLVFSSRRKIIFVHGCFWHRHAECALARLPKSKLEFWLPKLSKNAARDVKNIATLQRTGWEVMIIWECELRDTAALLDKIRGFLDA